MSEMTTVAEYVRMAEASLDASCDSDFDEGVRSREVVRAQVYATLALVAATQGAARG